MSARKKAQLQELRVELAGYHGLAGRLCKCLGRVPSPPYDEKTKQELEKEALQDFCTQTEKQNGEMR